MTRYFRYFFFFALIVLAASCKKKTPEDIGLPLLPGEDLLNAQFTDTATLITHTVKDDSLVTKNVSPILLGNLNDPIFGITRSSIFTQLSLSKTSPNFGTSPVLDSAVLSLVYSVSGTKVQSYGTQAPQRIDVYEVSEPINKDSIYRSDDLLQYYTTQQIGSSAIVPMAQADSIPVDTLKFPAHMRVRLDKVFFQNFLDNATYMAAYNSNTNFQSVFNGIYVKSSATPSSGQGAVISINLTDAYTRITLYYHNTVDTTSYYFGISKDGCTRFSRFEHDYSSSIEITNQLNTASTIQSDKVFVQPMAGVRTKIAMPYISDFFKEKKVSINKAELILPVDVTTIDPVFTAHPKLIATIADSALGPVIMPDFFEGAGYFGGEYDSVNHQYKFNIARHLQQVLNGTRKNQGLYIITNIRPTTVNRVQLIGGNKALPNRMRLKITYTSLK